MILLKVLARQFTPEPWERKNKLHKTAAKKLGKMKRERAKQEHNSSRPYHFMNTSFLDLQIHGIPKGFVKSFMVVLDTPLPKEQVEGWLEEAFNMLGRS